jgi:hypothetical protein
LVILISTLGAYSNYFHDALATCIFDENGKEICAGPLPITINIVLDRQGYTYGDTITVSGNVTDTFYQKNHFLLMEVNYPDGKLYKSDKITINKDRTFLYKFTLSANAPSGFYNVWAKDQAQSGVGTGFMFTAEPYTVQANHTDYQIPYRIDNGKIDSIAADPSEGSLTIHTINFVRHATFAIPKNLIDSISSGGKDHEKFNVFVDQRPIKFNETSDEKTSTLEFDIPPIKRGNSIDLREKATIKIVLSESESAHIRVGPKIPFGILSPLQQSKSGIAPDKIQCKDRLHLVIKASNGNPICVKPGNKSKLLERGWAFDSYQDYRMHPKIITDINNDIGIITWKNQTYYFETPHYTNDVYDHQVQISFHDVVFTLFPKSFRGGLPVAGCGGSYYWADAQFSDGTTELLHIFVNSKPCPDNSVPITLSTHTNPQAGLTFYDGKMRLLVYAQNQSNMR